MQCLDKRRNNTKKVQQEIAANAGIELDKATKDAEKATFETENNKTFSL